MCVRVHNLMLAGGQVVHFSPRFNFVTGHNGTGKSRVVAAVQLTLGARANQTGRGSQLNDFICNEKHIREATIDVVMYNGGKRAFRPETYGKYFVVRRTLKRSANPAKLSGSPFSVFYTEPESIGALSKVSGSQVDVKRVRDDFLRCTHIKPDNPMVILTQAESKVMLEKNNKGSLYQIFLQATNMQELGTQMEDVDRKLAMNQDVLTDLRAMLKHQKTKLDGLNDRLNRAGATTKLEADIVELEVKLGVRKVQEMQAQADAHQRDYKQRTADLQRLRDKREKLHLQAGKFDAPLENERRVLQDLQEEKQVIDREIEDKIRLEGVERKRQMRVVGTEIKEIRSELQARKLQVQHAIKQLKEEKRRLRRKSAVAEEAESVDELTEQDREVQQRLRQLTEKDREALHQRESNLGRILQQHESDLNTSARQCSAQKERVKSLQQQIRQCGDSNDPFASVKTDIARCVNLLSDLHPVYDRCLLLLCVRTADFWRPTCLPRPRFV